MKALLREPLLHFLVLGACLFGLYGLGSPAPPDRIVVTRGQMEALAASFVRTWQRAPTPEELEGLVREHVREEVMYREALALGLDRDDVVVRRRMRQKLEFLTQDLAEPAEPTDADLGAWTERHADSLRGEPRLTFRQVYLSPERRGPQVERDAAQLRVRLERSGAQADLAAAGDAFLLDGDFQDVPAGEVEALFGQEFASRLAELPVGQWQGPVKSGYGLHLVLVVQRTPGSLPAREEIRQAWAEERRREAREQAWQEMLARYEVTVEDLPPLEASR